jgi:hypothetical protein
LLNAESPLVGSSKMAASTSPILITAVAAGAAGLLVWGHSIASAGQSDAYYNAERSAKDFLFSYYDDFKKMDRTEIQSLVQAVCDADEEERRSVASDIGSRTRDRVRTEYDKV